MFNTGDQVTFNPGAYSGYAPGVKQWQLGGTAKIVGSRNVGGQQYYNIDQTAQGGGTGWVHSSGIGGLANNGGTPTPSTPSPTSSVATASSNLPAWAPPQTNIGTEKTAATTAAAAAPGQVLNAAGNITGGIENAVSNYKTNLPGIAANANNLFNVPALQDQANALQAKISQLDSMPALTTAGMAGSNQIDKGISSRFAPMAQTAEANYQQAAGNALNLTNILADPYKADIAALTTIGTQTLISYSNALDTNIKTLLAMPTLSLTQQGQLNDLAATQAKINQANYAAELDANARRYAAEKGLAGAEASAGATIQAANTAAEATVRASKIDQASKLAVFAMASGATMNGDGTLNMNGFDYNKYQGLINKVNSMGTGGSTGTNAFEDNWNKIVTGGGNLKLDNSGNLVRP